MTGRTLWFPKDAGFYRRQKIVAAGIAFERAPAILDWLTCEAKSQADGDRDEHGWVKSGYAAIAHGACFGHATADDVRPVVSHLVHVGLLDDFEEANGGIFTARISGWREDVFLKLEATRGRRRRAEKAETPAQDTKDAMGRSGTERDTSQNVPQSPLQDRTGQKEEEEEARASARQPTIVHPQLSDVLARLRVVDGLAPAGDDATELSVNQALQRADRDGVPILDLADATVSQALEYSARGPLRASAGSLMHGLLDRRQGNSVAELRRRSAEVRSEFERPNRPGRRKSANERADELERKARELEAKEAQA